MQIRDSACRRKTLLGLLAATALLALSGCYPYYHGYYYGGVYYKDGYHGKRYPYRGHSHHGYGYRPHGRDRHGYRHHRHYRY